MDQSMDGYVVTHLLTKQCEATLAALEGRVFFACCYDTSHAGV